MTLTNVVWNALKHPVTNLLFAIALAVVTFWLARATKEPTYYSARPILAAYSSLGDQRLRILWDGVEVRNVISVDIALWNAGRAYIDSRDVSQNEPIKIVPAEPIRILSTQIAKKSRGSMILSAAVKQDSVLQREVIEVQLGPDEAWEYMEGTVVNILYDGSTNADFDVSGRIKGAPGGFAKKTWKPTSKAWITYFGQVFVGVLFGLVGFLHLFIAISARKRGENNRISWLLGPLSLLVSASFISAFVVQVTAPGIPSWLL